MANQLDSVTRLGVTAQTLHTIAPFASIALCSDYGSANAAAVCFDRPGSGQEYGFSTLELALLRPQGSPNRDVVVQLRGLASGGSLPGTLLASVTTSLSLSTGAAYYTVSLGGFPSISSSSATFCFVITGSSNLVSSWLFATSGGVWPTGAVN